MEKPHPYSRRAMMGEQQWQYEQQFWPIEWVSREELMRRYPDPNQPEQQVPQPANPLPTDAP